MKAINFVLIVISICIFISVNCKELSAAEIEMVFVKGGCFQMGDTFESGDKDEKPLHEVCLNDFYIGKYEVTQGQWQTVMGNNPSNFKDCGSNCPVERVSWADVQDFIKQLRVVTGKQYRLPSEAEWEYAARSGGKKEQWAGTNSQDDLKEYAWYTDNSGEKTHPVGQKKPNGLGIYDMSGNAGEWVLDNYGEDYYGKSPKDNPQGASGGQYKVLRGGSWDYKPLSVRTAYRDRDGLAYRLSYYGFRLAAPAQAYTQESGGDKLNVAPAPVYTQESQWDKLNQECMALFRLGQYDKALVAAKKALEFAELEIGPAQPHMATSLNNLAEVYRAQAQYELAKPLYKRSQEIWERTLGPDHPLLATSLNNLAHLYNLQEQYPQAAQLYKRSMEIWEKILGPDHPTVATSINNLAYLYNTQDKYDQAEPLYKRSLKIREKALGPDHPDVATSLNNLAEVYRVQGKFKEAEPLYKRSMEIWEKILGPDHPTVAASLNNLAYMHYNQDMFAKAEPLYRRSLAIWEKVFGPNHPNVAISLENIAALYRKSGRERQAEALEKQAAAIRAMYSKAKDSKEKLKDEK